VVVAVLIAVVIVAVAAAIPLATPDNQPSGESLALPEYDVESTGVTPVPSTGTVEPTVDGDGEVVVIDDEHANRFDRADIHPMVAAITRAGGSVRFHDGGELNDSLENADAFVVIDPGSEYDMEDVRAVRAFTNGGGRVVLMGEPDRKAISGGLFTSSVITRESHLTTLGSAFNMTFGTGYLYNPESNDGNYQYVAVRPTGDLPVDRAAMYTATSVESPGGNVLVRTAAGTVEFGTDRTQRFPVVVQSGTDANVLGVGDATFVSDDRYLAGDNEVLVRVVVDFLLNNNRPRPSDDGGMDGADNETATDGADNETATDGTDNETDTDGAGSDDASAIAAPRRAATT
jgi:hypothetical protein